MTTARSVDSATTLTEARLSMNQKVSFHERPRTECVCVFVFVRGEGNRARARETRGGIRRGAKKYGERKVHISRCIVIVFQYFSRDVERPTFKGIAVDESDLVNDRVCSTKE